jgi:hypothetical protein
VFTSCWRVSMGITSFEAPIFVIDIRHLPQMGK